MAIEFIRIDDRLIHGQIVTAWAKNKQINKIWIVDDGVAKDEFLKGIMQLVAPSDKELIISGLDEMPELLKKLDNEDPRVLILVKFPEVAQKIYEAGVKFRELNIGGMGANPKREKLFKNISASSEEVDTLREIKKMGVDVYFQVTPDERKTEFE